MSENQVPMPPIWTRLPCLIGIHKREVVFGWNDHLDDPSKSGYYGFAFCLRCGRTLHPGPRFASTEKGD